MKFSFPTAGLAMTLLLLDSSTLLVEGQMVKMCLFYDKPSGHARSDPIINQACPSDHVHTFYGPQNFHPSTSYDNLRRTSPSFSSSPYVENQSLYWHPTIYSVTTDQFGVETYTRAPEISTSPYYRWDNSVLPATEAFPPGFRMIAHSTDFMPDPQVGGNFMGSIITECCNYVNGDDEDCVEWNDMRFPTQTCDFLGIALAMPTCWNGDLGINNGPGHKDHMAYTLDGTIAGPCPSGFNRRLPQVQLFVRVNNYKGGTYVLSDGSNSVFHVDFFNGWEDGTLKNIIDNCPIIPTEIPGDFNPDCNCDQFLTSNPSPAGAVCDVDVRELIVDEPTDIIVGALPRGTCMGPGLIPKSWGSDPPLDCATTPTTPSSPTTPAPGVPVPTTPSPVIVSQPTTPAPVPAPTAPSPEEEEVDQPTDEEEDGEGDGEEEAGEEEAGEGDGADCEVECCFESLTECEEEVEFICGDDNFLPDCEEECEMLLEEGEIEDCDLDNCFEDCNIFQDNCFEAEELLCIPCEGAEEE